MTDKIVSVEGASLEEALQKASEELGIERVHVAFEIDRAHLANGASTIRIQAKRLTDEEIARARETREARPPAPARTDRRDDRRPGDRGGGDRGGRSRRDDGRGPPRRGRDGGGGGGGGRGRGDRDRGGDRGGPDRGRRDARAEPYDKDRERERNKERDERLREVAREHVKRVLAGEGPVQIPDLNSYERHLVHTIVAETGGLSSHSTGEGLRKTVHIARAEAKPETATTPEPANQG